MMDYAAMGASSEAINLLESFWPRTTRDVQNLTSSDFKNPELPLARIKKIMKLDEEVKMISAEAPIIFAKAAEIFIQEVTIRAWLHTEENKRRTLQRNDVALAISKYDQFDFLIDIVPREEIKPSKKESHSPNSSSAGGGASSQATGSLTLPTNTSVINTMDPNTANLLNVINGTGGTNAVLATANTAGSNGNVQYYFALPNGTTATSPNGTPTSGGLPLQLQGLQAIQGLPANLQGLQTIQGLQGIQGAAQIILSQPNGQPAIFSVANRDC